MHEERGFPRLLTLAEAAKILGVSYERVRVLVAEGRIPAIEVPGVGRAIRRQELERFQMTRRPAGRPATRQSAPRRARRGPGSVPDLLALVERKTGTRPALSDYRYLVKVGLLPRRRDFPRGEEGKRLCLARQCRLFVPIMRLRKQSVAAPYDLAIGLKFFRYRVLDGILARAMLSYLYGHRRRRAAFTDDDMEQFILNESFEERPPRLPHRMERRQREVAYRALSKIGFGRPFTARDMAAARDGVGLPGRALPDSDTSGQSPDLSWGGMFKDIRAIDEKIDRLVDQAIIEQQQRSHRQVILYRPFATPEELDKAWDVARPLLTYIMPPLLQRLRGVSRRAHVLYVNMTIVKTVASCLIHLREQGDAAFSPFRGDLAAFNALWQEACISLMVAPPPEPMASFVRQVMTTPPKTDQERRQIVGRLEQIARSSSISGGDREVVQAMLDTVKHPSKKKVKKMLETLQAWKARSQQTV